MTDTAVLVVISVDPETSHRANEAVRIALGIIAGENEVVIALLGPATRILSGEVEDYIDGEDILKHLATLKRLGQVVHVQRDSIPGDRDWNPTGIDTAPLSRPELAALVAQSRRVLVF